MARLVKGCPTLQLQQGGTEEPETNTIFPQQEEQTGTVEGKVIADYDPEPEGSGPKIKAFNEEEENADAEYAKMDLPPVGTLHQRTITYKVAERIKQVHWV